MKIKRLLVRILIPISVVILSACQTTPSEPTAAAQPETMTAQQTAPASTPETPLREQAGEEGVPVAVFLADTELQDGWQPVQLDQGVLYLNPQPVIIRDDLTGVQAGASQEGDGLLALELSPDAQSKVTQATTEYPNKRLALIVGQTMLAAPGYSTPVTTGSLIFVVGTEQNAMAVARAIAGVDDDDTSSVSDPDLTPPAVQ